MPTVTQIMRIQNVHPNSDARYSYPFPNKFQGKIYGTPFKKKEI